MIGRVAERHALDETVLRPTDLELLRPTLFAFTMFGVLGLPIPERHILMLGSGEPKLYVPRT